MRYRRLLHLLIVVTFIITAGINHAAAKAPQSKYGPVLNGGQKWRIGFCQSESYTDYASNLYYILKGMEGAGWISGIKDLPYQEGWDDTKAMWNWLATHDVGPYVRFVKDAYYDLKEMAGNEARLTSRLQKQQNIDLMIVTGTAAGILLAKADHQVPTLIFSTSDPVGAGIIKSPADSGKDNIWAHVDQGQFRRQIQVFHDIFRYKKMGLVYEHSDLVRNYIALNDIEAIAKQRKFDLVSYHVKEPANPGDEQRYYSDLRVAYGKLAREVDAMLLTVSPVKPELLPELLAPFYRSKIPVFSQSGALEVKSGALMSITQNDYPNLQKFAAETIAKVLHGIKPRQLAQIFESTPRIILNLEVAKKIGYKPAFDILIVADDIYRNIETGR